MLKITENTYKHNWTNSFLYIYACLSVIDNQINVRTNCSSLSLEFNTVKFLKRKYLFMWLTIKRSLHKKSVSLIYNILNHQKCQKNLVTFFNWLSFSLYHRNTAILLFDDQIQRKSSRDTIKLNVLSDYQKNQLGIV